MSMLTNLYKLLFAKRIKRVFEKTKHLPVKLINMCGPQEIPWYVIEELSPPPFPEGQLNL